MKVFLFTTFYIDGSISRQLELEFCVKKNLSNNDINDIYFLIDEHKYSYDKLIELGAKEDNIIKIKNRPKYSDFISYYNNICSPDDILIIANTDIYFDTDAIELIKTNISIDKVYALTRYDIEMASKSITLFNRLDSQDTWCFKGKVDLNKLYCDFELGVPGCDNRISHEIDKAGYAISNPAHDIKTIHYHSSQVRNYLNKPYRPIPPPYKMLSITKL